MKCEACGILNAYPFSWLGVTSIGCLECGANLTMRLKMQKTNFERITQFPEMLADYLICPYDVCQLPASCPSGGERTCACFQCITDWLNKLEES